MDKLHELREVTSSLESGTFEGKPVSPKCAITLNNTDGLGKVVQSSEAPWLTVKNILDYLSFQNAPFDLMRGVLNGMLSLFYPTDDTHNAVTLGYCRQREWRIVSGLEIDGNPLSVLLSETERNEVREISPEFWDKSLSIHNFSNQAKTFSRIEEAEVIRLFGGSRITYAFKSIIVPKSVLNAASELFQVPVRTL